MNVNSYRSLKSEEKGFEVFLIYVNQVTPGAGPILIVGLNLGKLQIGLVDSATE